MSLTPTNNLLAMSLTPVNSFLAVLLTPAKNCRLFGYFPVTRKTTPAINFSFFASVVDTAEQFIAGVNIHSRISPRIFEKIQNVPNGLLGGCGRH